MTTLYTLLALNIFLVSKTQLVGTGNYNVKALD